ncbi:MAG: hypothetical protein JWL73_3370 [Actinomycetia bacterium]|nr:hypothetical protein [Actinomycetes bacterium]
MTRRVIRRWAALRRRTNGRAQGSGGFTLIELLIGIVISGVIIAPLSAGVILGLKTSNDTATRLASSTDAQLLTAAYITDVESAGSAAGDVVATPTANTECSGITNVLRLRWTTSDTGSAVKYQAAYAISGSATAGWKMRRFYCVGAGAASISTVARNLASASAATVAVSGTKISMTVTEAVNTGNPTPYVFTVSGNRRTP